MSFILMMCLCVGCVHMSASACGSQKRALHPPGAGVTGRCRSPDVGDMNQSLVLRKSSTRS